MFKDEADIYVKAGHGGEGCVSFRREKYVPFGGPDGGNGGKGGDLVLRASKSIRTLSSLRGKRLFKAHDGKAGFSRNKSGKDGEDCIIELPLGTLVSSGDNVLCDLTEDGKDYVVARGGKGGKGNRHFVSSSNQYPTYAQEGCSGEERGLFLSLKLIADVGLVGFPNAGKSSLLSCLSRAYPKIASYPFTTLEPNLGVIYINEFEHYVMADIPGLIEGASEGLGLGIKFLKHIERNRVLLFLIDAYFETDNQFNLLAKELSSYSEELMEKPYFIALNKMDLFYGDEKASRLDKFLSVYNKGVWHRNNVNIFPISCATGEGLDLLKKELYRLLLSDSI